MTTFAANIASGFGDMLTVVKIEFTSGTKYYCQKGTVLGQWPGVIPQLLSVTPISQQLDIDTRLTAIDQFSFTLSDQNKAIRDILASETTKGKAVTVYLTFQDMTIAQSRVEFSGKLAEWSGLTEITFSCKSNLGILQNEVNPTDAAFVVRAEVSTAWSLHHPVTLEIGTVSPNGIYSKGKYIKISSKDADDVTYVIQPEDTIAQMVAVIDTTNEGGVIYSAEVLGSYGSTLAWKLKNGTYALTTEYLGVYNNPDINILGFETMYSGTPAEVIDAVLTDISYPPAEIDTASLAEIVNYWPKLYWRRYVDEPITAAELLQEIAENLNGFFAIKEGLLSFVLYRPRKPAETLITIDSNKYLEEDNHAKMNMRLDAETLINRVIVNYGWEGTKFIITEAFDHSDSQTAFGEIKEKNIDSKLIGDEGLPIGYYAATKNAKYLAHRILTWQRLPIIFLDVSSNIETATLNVADYVIFTSDQVSTAGWTERYFLVLSKTISGAMVELVLIDCTRLKACTIAPTGTPDNYTACSAAQKLYGFISAGEAMANGDEASHVF